MEGGVLNIIIVKKILYISMIMNYCNVILFLIWFMICLFIGYEFYYCVYC